MNINEDISKVAYELYEKSGYVEGRAEENWLEAEMIVLKRVQSQEKEQAQISTAKLVEGKSSQSSNKLKGSKQR